MRPALTFCWLLTLSLALWSAGARAQESDARAQETAKDLSAEEPSVSPPSVSPSTLPWQTQETVRPTAPDVYLLPDESGKLRKVLGFRYEDFFKAWRRDKGAATAAPPRYVLNDLSISGEVNKTHARLRVELEITIRAAGWIDIPVQLPGFIVQQLSIEKQADGECLIFDAQRHGHVVWLSGQAGEKRKLVLVGLTKLKLSTGNHGIELHLPRATTPHFSLRVPASSTRFECSPELTLSTSARDGEAGKQKIEVQLLGQANPLRLNWTPAEENASNQTALVEVEGETTVHLDRRRVFYAANLKINSFNSPLEQIRVRMPPGAKLIGGELSEDYEIQEVEPAAERHGQVLVIRRKGSRQELWELQLMAERPMGSLTNATECVVEGFEVLESFRQSGRLTLEIDDQLQAYFDTHGEIDQTPLRKSATNSEGRSILGQFQYSRFPWKLVVFISPRQRRVSVKPTYHLTFNSESARLDVQYDYQLTGAQIFSLRINLQGWKLIDAPIESGGLIDTNGVVETREGRLVLPVVDSSTQQLRLNLSFRKDLQLGKNTFFLPEPLGAFAVDGELLVDSTEVLQVVPSMDEMTGLSLIANNEEVLLAGTTRGESSDDDQIRLRTFLARPKFVAEVTQRPLQLVAVEQTEVEIDQQTVHVRQKIGYQAKYRPVSQLTLSLPEQLRSNDSLSVTLDGEPLPFGPDISRDDGPLDGPLEGLGGPLADDNTQLRSMTVSLPRPMQNAIPLEITYELPTPRFLTDESTPLLLPLVVPRDSVSSHKVLISATRPVFVTVNQRSAPDTWTVATEAIEADSSATTSRTKLRLLTTEKPSFLSLNGQLDSTDQEQLATLERAWIQSWIAAGQRQERAAFRFHTAHAAVFVQLPADFGNMEIEVLLDGDPWQYKLLKGNRLSVALPSNGQRRSHTLELRYQKPAFLPSWGKLQNLFPRLECRLASAPIYWQLILPRGWQVATSPSQLIPDYWLGWKNYRWGRQPTLSQAELEQITDAVSGAAPTPLSAQYVYRAFEIPIEIPVIVLRQAWLLLAGILVAFGIGLLWLYTPLVRNGLFWLGLSLTLLLGIFTYPEVTLLVTQAIIAGGLLTFVTGVLRHVFGAAASASIPSSAYPHLDPSIDTTENWQQQTPSEGLASSGTTATLRSGGPTS